MYYLLHKMAHPGFTFATNLTSNVVEELECHVCRECRTFDMTDFEHPPIPVAYQSMLVKDKLDHLLASPCGAEFMLEHFSTITELNNELEELEEKDIRQKGLDNVIFPKDRQQGNEL